MKVEYQLKYFATAQGQELKTARWRKSLSEEKFEDQALRQPMPQHNRQAASSRKSAMMSRGNTSGANLEQVYRWHIVSLVGGRLGDFRCLV